jgi:hypothetical protein
MKTIEEVTAEMNQCLERASAIRKDRLIAEADAKKQIKALNKKFGFLKKIRTYLEFSPKSETLEKQRDQLREAIKGFQTPARFDAWFSWNTTTHRSRKDYKRKFIKPLQDQIETLNFILNDNNR